MLDLFNTPVPRNADVQVFTPNAGSSAVSIYQYFKPRGKSMLYIYLLGPGGGGGGGFTRAAGAAGGGGGGGGSGGQATLLVPLALLPDYLYVFVRDGGESVAANTTGTAANRCSVAIDSRFATNDTLLASSSLSSYGSGGAGTSAGGGTGALGASAASIADMPLAGLGIWNSIGGQSGTNGGAQTGAAGSAVSLPTTGNISMGGTGGGGTTSADFAGGAITSVAGSYISDAKPTAAAAGSNPGSSGITLGNLFFSFPGLGGGSSNTAVGGNGGWGAFGCGGGGGGAGTTGGRGGKGGPGICIMIAW